MSLKLSNTAHFHMDESLFLGAAARILEGDFLLRSYWFDRPLLTAFSLIPGIAIAGENNLGFRLSGIILGIAILVLAFKMTRMRVTKSDFFGPALPLLFAWICLPMVSTHVVSAFSEPPFLFFLLLSGFKLFKLFVLLQQQEKGSDSAIEKIQERQLKNSLICLTLAMLCKPTAILWLPPWLACSMVSMPMPQIKARLFALTKPSLALLAIGVIYPACNPAKFAAFTFYQVFSIGSSSGLGHYIQSISDRFYELSLAMGGFPILLLLFCIYNLRASRIFEFFSWDGLS